MSTIRLNFIPVELRKEQTGFCARNIGGVPCEHIFGVLAGVVGVLLIIHLVLLGLVLVRFAENQVYNRKWASLGAEKKIFDEVSAEIKDARTGLDALKPVLSQSNIVWAGLLNEISDSVPKGVWLTKMTYAAGQLNIFGSSVSKTHSEMVTAGTFVSSLKDRKNFMQSFVSIDVDSIQRRAGASLSIADFTLKAKQK